MTARTVTVSVVIKALNEEKKIALTIESALRAISNVGGEVIIADSHSTDRTVEIASRYPVKIVKLIHPKDRCCGVGGQLGYQISVGTYVWIVDGDMELSEGFLEDAISCLEEESRLAGVSGRVVEKNLESLEFRARLSRAPKNLQPGYVDRLDGGGVYKRSAIESIGYFTNRNMHSYEEYELAARLRSNDWLLKRIPAVAVSHYGHKTEAFALLLKRWRTGYVRGIGELLRSSIGKPHFSMVLREILELRLYSTVVLWWTVIFGLTAFGLTEYHVIGVVPFVVLIPFAVMAIKKRSFLTAIYSVASWNYYATGMLCGLMSRQIPPCNRIDAEIMASCLAEKREQGYS
ncbi:Poly-beta-1,6-N-acetyl-D-glucosamine synthase [Azoarcus sp. Aa7]|nr:Poly-beta-1,6-N-acetyl-D-glucosamine synthase [Azoarcus sp. Aa7]